MDYLELLGDICRLMNEIDEPLTGNQRAILAGVLAFNLSGDLPAILKPQLS